MKKSRLKDLVLAITYKCNSRCRMCNIWQKTDYRYELPIKSIQGLPRNLEDINISGGEPFLHSNLPDLLKFLHRHCPNANIVISSNGFATSLITKQLKLIKTNMPNIGIAFSLDGIGAKHDEIRGIPGGFERVLATIKAVKEIGITNIKLSFTLGDYNARELLGVYRLSKELGAEFSLTIVHSSDNFFSANNKIQNRYEMLKSLAWLIKQELKTPKLKSWARAYYAWGAYKMIATGKRVLPDYSGVYNLFIDPRGDVFACDVASRSIGELSQTGLNVRQGLVKDPACEKSWMMCTARPAIKRHPCKVLFWIFINKLKFLF